MKELVAEYDNQNFQNKLKSILGVFYKPQNSKNDNRGKNKTV